MSKVFKKVAKVALPVVGTALGGPVGGALGGAAAGALGGGGLKGALLGAAGGALGGGLLGGAPSATGIGLFDSLNSGIFNSLSPLRSIGSQLFGGISDGFGRIFTPLKEAAGSLVGGSSQSPLPWANLPSPYKTPLGSFGNLGSFNPNATNPVNEGVFGGLFGDGTNLQNASNIAALIKSLMGDEPPGTLSQQDILDQMNRDRQIESQRNASFIESLNSGPIKRNRVTPAIDYYTYGSRPEALFFDKPEGEAIEYKPTSPLAMAG